MIVLTRQEEQAASGDALLALHLKQVSAGCCYLQELAAEQQATRVQEVIDQAAHLCEMSRDLLYRLNRVSVSQIEDILQVFALAVRTLESLKLDDANAANLIDSYRWHIQKRIGLLEREIEPYSKTTNQAEVRNRE